MIPPSLEPIVFRSSRLLLGRLKEPRTDGSAPGYRGLRQSDELRACLETRVFMFSKSPHREICIDQEEAQSDPQNSVYRYIESRCRVS